MQKNQKDGFLPMVEVNWRGVAFCICVCILCYLAMWIIIQPIQAEPNESYVVVETIDTFSNPSDLNSTMIPNWTEPRIALNNNTRITQGQCIEIGGYYDVSGVIGFTSSQDHNSFGYYGRYEDSFDPTDNMSLQYRHVMPDARKEYYQFFVDPEIFGDRIGYWYQYSGEYERSANKRAFYVSDRCIKAVNENTTYVEVDNKPTLINPRDIAPRHVSDVLTSNDDPMYMNVTGEFQAWVFGKTTTLLAQQVNVTAGDPIFPSSVVKGWSEGEYTIVLVKRGEDGRYGLEYERDTRGTSPKESLVPILRSQNIVDVTGLQPSMVLSKLEGSLRTSTDDTYTKYDVVIEEPSVEISGYQELVIGNNSLLEVTGYTNRVAGTPITLYIDREEITGKSVKYPGMTIATENASVGDYRTFHGYLPLYYEDISIGEHTLTAVLPNGKKSAVTFYRRAEPEQHYQQPKYFAFIDGHPFIPEPTPIVVEKEVVREVIKTEYKTIIEKEPVNYDKLAWETISRLVIPATAIIVVVGIPLAYILSVVVRAFAERRKRKIEENKP